MASTSTKVKDTVLRHLQDARDTERVWKDKFHEWELMWMMKYKRSQVQTSSRKNKQQNSTRSMQYVGYGHAQMETGAAKLTNALFSASPPFDCEPMPAASLDEAMQVKKLHEISFKRDRVKQKIRGADRFLTIYGTVPLKHAWEDRWVRRGQRVPVLLGFSETGKQPVQVSADEPELAVANGLMEVWGYEVVRKPFRVYSGPCTRVVDPYYFHIDPEAETVEDARWVQEEFIHSEDHVKQMMKDGVYDNIRLKDVDFYSADRDNEIDYRQRRRDAAFLPNDDRQNTGEPDGVQTGLYRLLEEWHDDRIITLVGQSNPKVLRDRPNPFFHGTKPYTSLHYIKLPGEFWSIPMAKQIEGPQHELNMVRRLRSDGLTSRIDPLWRISSTLDARLGVNQLKWTPNGTIVAERGEIEPLVAGELPIYTYKEEEVFQKDGDMITGMTDIFRGAAPASTTATVGTLNANFSSDRMSDIVDSVSEGLEDMLNMRHALYGQFGQEEESIVITGSDGPKFINIPLETVRKNYVFQFNAGREAARTELRRNQFMQALTVVSQNPALMMRTNFDTLLHDFWLMFEAHDPGRYILAEGEQNELAQIVLAQQILQGRAAGGGDGGSASPRRANTPSVDNTGDLASALNQETAPKVRNL